MLQMIADEHVMSCNSNLEISVRDSENTSMKAVQRAQVLFHVSSPIADFFIDKDILHKSNCNC